MVTPPAHRRPPRWTFGSATLVTIALAVGTWLGATAPSVSPVAPPAPAPPTTVLANPGVP